MLKQIHLGVTLRKMKIELIIVVILFVASFIFGWYIANAQGILVLEVRLWFTNAFGWLHRPFSTISNVIIESIFPWTRPQPRYMSPSQIPSLSRTQAMEDFAILTFVLFVIGLLYTFAATTLPGVMPLVGVVLVGLVAVVEGVGLGAGASGATQYLNPFYFEPSIFLIRVVPILLTLIGEIFSSSAGFHIALASLRAKHGSQWFSFKGAWRDASRIYVLVIILLAMAGIVDLIGSTPF